MVAVAMIADFAQSRWLAQLQAPYHIDQDIFVVHKEYIFLPSINSSVSHR
jgi:hypothetical protein